MKLRFLFAFSFSIFVAGLACAEIYDLTGNNEFCNFPIGMTINSKDKIPIVADIYPTIPGEELLLVANSGTSSFLVPVNGTTGNIINGPFEIPPEAGVNSEVGTPCCGDFNGDGYWDVAVTRVWKTGNANALNGNTRVYIMLGGVNGLTGAFQTSGVFDLSSPTIVARDVSNIGGTSCDELFLSGINKLSRVQTTIQGVVYNAWVLSYSARAIRNDFSVIWNSVLGDLNAPLDSSYICPLDNPSLPGFYSAIERSMPVISHEDGANGNFVFSMLYALPRCNFDFAKCVISNLRLRVLTQIFHWSR